jgi:hypothetical protein
LAELELLIWSIQTTVSFVAPEGIGQAGGLVGELER